MAQHKMKKKTALPTGAKQKSQKRIQKSSQRVRKGGNIYIAPKKAAAIKDAKMSAEVSRIINDRNEGRIRTRADNDVGKEPPKKEEK